MQIRSCLYFILLFIGSASLLKAQTITQFVLVNAASDQDIIVLEEGVEINLSEVGTSLNIRAEVSSTVGSIRFGLDGTANFQTESTPPYAMAGDNSGDYSSWTPTIGNHSLTATAYSESGAGGSVLDTRTLNFSVVEDQIDIDVPDNAGTGALSISGELKKWHKITLSFDGPEYAELQSGLNPFLDYRLVATFTKGEKVYQVPGYFAADGNAGETSAASGNIWRVHFAPDEIGVWNYTISFRLGDNLAINPNLGTGTPVPPIHGQSGTLEIGNTDKNLPDNRARGRLQYVGQRYLQYAETGEYFLKGGADAPENFLAYDDFDNTPDFGGRRKSWAPHAEDWNSGDPSWQNGKGTEIIGAVNYLASKGINVFSFLTMNIQGDDRNVFPYVSDDNFRRFDCSKLDQWEVVFEHADELGMYLHFKTQETENDHLLDGGALGVDRQLYYRELVARFGHHLALNWNLGEENTQSTNERRAMATWFKENDPYNHNRVIHTYPGQIDDVYEDLVGNQSDYSGVSIQTNWNQVYDRTKDWVENSEASGKPWIVANDEQGNANTGVPPDPGYPGYDGSNPDLHDIRQEVLWGNLMAGGAGVEYYFGYQLPESDLSLQNYRSRDQTWDYVRHALSFFRALPFTQMTANNNLVSDGWCFAQEGQQYAIYLKDGDGVTLELSTGGEYSVQWYNPRTGAYSNGEITAVTGPGSIDLGAPPSETNQDWAIIVRRDFGGNIPPMAVFTADPMTGQAPLLVNFDASQSNDQDGNILFHSWNFGDGTISEGQVMSHVYEEPGTYTAKLTVSDDGGAIDVEEVIITVTEVSTGGCGTAITMYSRDFPYSNSDFYLDDFTDSDLLAINPNTHQSAEVSQLFQGESCIYNLTFHGVGESDGQSKFKLFINDQFLGAKELPLSNQDWELGAAYNMTFNNIPLNPGDEITVYGEVGTDGQEFSRARWLKIDLVPVTAASGSGDCAATWEEQGGLVVIEMENNTLIEDWEFRTEEANYFGEGYIQWTGNQHLNQTGNGVLYYPIQINTPGTYILDWHVGVGLGDDGTEHNDSWVKIEADNFYAYRNQGNSSLKPKPECNNDPNYDCPNGSSTNGFFKNYGGSIDDWAWQSRTSDHEAHTIYAVFNNPGVYTVEVNARSSYHRLDRMVLYQPDLVSQNEARDDANPESICVDSGSNSELYQLQFIVGDGEQALANANVLVNGQSYTTNADGQVTISGLSEGIIDYEISLAGYSAENAQVLLSGSLTVLVTLDVMTTSLDDVVSSNAIKVFPNPAGDQLYLELQKLQEGGQARIITLNGKVVRTELIKGQVTPINLMALPKGTYIMEVVNEGWKERVLFVKGE